MAAVPARAPLTAVRRVRPYSGAVSSAVPPRIAAAACALLAALCIGGVQQAAAEGAPPLAVTGVSPRPDAGDTRTAGLFRATVSPNADGVNDALSVAVAGPAGAAIALVDASKGGIVARGTLDGAGSGQVAYTPGYDAGSILLRACIAGTTTCAADAVQVDVRSVTVAVQSLAGVRPGGRASLRIDADGPVRLGLRDLALPHAPTILERTVAPGSYDLEVPRLRPGLWGVVATAPDGRTSTAPLVVRPAAGRPATAALVVIPTLTLRAYDTSDNDRDGSADTWYAGKRPDGIQVAGGFAATADGQPWHGARRLLAALRFLRSTHVAFDVVADADLAARSTRLDRYRALVFAGHEEYYTLGMWQAVLRYRNGGGRLWFMQANSFYTRVAVDGGRMRVRDFAHRTPSRSDYMIAGGGYTACCWAPAMPRFVLARGVRERLPWLFRGVRLRAGGTFGYAPGEADAVNKRLSPHSTIVIAEARLPGGRPAHVSYYTGPKGSEVLDLGTVAALEQLELDQVPAVVKQRYRRMMVNAWNRFRRP